LRGLFCLDDREFTILGEEGDSLLRTLQIEVRICINSSLNNNLCQSQGQIDEFFNEKPYMNTLFQIQNYENPIAEKITTLYKIRSKLKPD